MRFYLGIDGGGTKTKVAVVNDMDHVIYMGYSGPSSIDTVDNETTFKHIYEAVIGYFDENPVAVFESVFCGLGGIVTDEDVQLVENLLKGLPGVKPHTHIRARNDLENALYSGRCFGGGMVLICGTGSVAYGYDLKGNSHKAGGWSFKEGDFGSAYDLGMKAIRHAVKALDERVSQDDFSKEVIEALGLKKPADIVKLLNEKYLERTWIASLAPMVTKHADLGNPYARKYIDEATEDLKLMLHAVYKHLDLRVKKLVIVGSLGLTAGYFQDKLFEKIFEIDPKIKPVKTKMDPARAAAMMANKIYDNQ